MPKLRTYQKLLLCYTQSESILGDPYEKPKFQIMYLQIISEFILLSKSIKNEPHQQPFLCVPHSPEEHHRDDWPPSGLSISASPSAIHPKVNRPNIPTCEPKESP